MACILFTGIEGAVGTWLARQGKPPCGRSSWSPGRVLPFSRITGRGFLALASHKGNLHDWANALEYLIVRRPNRLHIRGSAQQVRSRDSQQMRPLVARSARLLIAATARMLRYPLNGHSSGTQT